MHDAIVIGGGIGGLSAAIALGARGHNVMLLESAHEVGGKAGRTMVEGIEVDTGPSVLTMVDVFERIFDAAGLRLADHVTLLSPEPGFEYSFADGVTLQVSSNIEQTLDNVHAALGSTAKRDLSRFLAYAARIWQAAAPEFVYGDAPSLQGVLSGGVRSWASMMKIDPLSSMWGAIKRHVHSPHLRMLLARYATYNGSDVRTAPATLNCISHVELAMGGYGVAGGMYELVRALVAAAQHVGVSIRTGVRARQILATGGRVTGVALDGGETLDCNVVVANADVAHIAGQLLSKNVPHKLSAPKTPSMSGMNFIARAARRDNRVAHTVLFPDDYLAEFDDIWRHDRPPQDPTVYVCAQSLCHRRRGWNDAEPLFVMANAPAEPEGTGRDQAVYQALENRMWRTLVDRNVVSPTDRIVWRRTPKELAARFAGSRGAIYGAASNSPSAAFQRPANQVAGVVGLYLASGTAHPGGGVPMAALSGVAAARAVERTFGNRSIHKGAA